MGNSLQQNLTIRLLRVLRYNKARTERALELMSPEKRDAFHIIPFLLHVNHQSFPGFVDDPKTPLGLINYSLRDELTEALHRVFPEQQALIDDMKPIWPKRRMIESLVLMGSIGTIAQSEQSDFDYWVCVDGTRYKQAHFRLLQKKLHQIELWAEKQFGMEVHFFLSDIEKVRANDFGVADGESSGSAQAIFLKAEFYTTNIVVAGKAPFWWLLHEGATDQQYQQLQSSLKAGVSPEPKWFMDLGNIERMDTAELFGAAIWQISKAMDSPFKSVLKMAKLEVFLANIDSHQPLCSLLRTAVHNGTKAEGGQEFIDPYGIMFDHIIEHYQKAGETETVELLQLCLYLKSDCGLSLPADESAFHFKRKIIMAYVEKWGWSRDKIKKVDRIKYWDFKELSQIGKRIHAFLIGCYRRISVKIADHKQMVSKEDVTVIGRKIDSFYSKKENKIDYMRNAFEEGAYCKIVTIKAEPQSNNRRRWSLYRGNQIDWNDSALGKVLMKSAWNPIEIVLWAVFNGVMDGETKIMLSYHAEPVTERDLLDLTKVLEKLFPPVRISDIKRNALLVPFRIINCLAVVNFESRRHKPESETLKLIYYTSWGELYCVDGFKALEAMRFDLCDVDPAPNKYFYAPDGSYRDRLFVDFKERADMDFSKELRKAEGS
ncbi:class I adenylate cyclase [Planctobacterium marinum]|uniref:Adenylate cyclase class-I N-terminal domain-containing protein n=1 Tax=Planctobacterium marinum TaxID=1631968 RepID=A0AA48HCW2_9ALTE|nr:hypothetical protein MACH26_02090 [Planctobacterium marinum]